MTGTYPAETAKAATSILLRWDAVAVSGGLSRGGSELGLKSRRSETDEESVSHGRGKARTVMKRKERPHGPVTAVAATWKPVQPDDE